MSTSILKNTNFWGILISNLIMGNLCVWFMGERKFALVVALALSISVILVYFILFKKINIATQTTGKLLFYSFITCIITTYIGTVVLGMRFIGDMNIIKILFINLFIVLMTVPFWLTNTLVNFFWLLRERRQSNGQLTIDNE